MIETQYGRLPAPRPPAAVQPGFLLATGAVLASCLSASAWLGLSSHGHTHRLDTAAVGELKTLATAQTLFREGDRDGDGESNYAASLAELGSATVIDDFLASGTKFAYTYALRRTTDGRGWAAIATPLAPSELYRYFATDQTGRMYYRTEGPFTFDGTGAITSEQKVHLLGR